MSDAEAILTALQAAKLPVIGVCVLDAGDPTTWRLDGKLTADERAQATALLAQLVTAVDAPVPTLDQVIEWCAGKFGETITDAQTALMRI